MDNEQEHPGEARAREIVRAELEGLLGGRLAPQRGTDVSAALRAALVPEATSEDEARDRVGGALPITTPQEFEEASAPVRRRYASQMEEFARSTGGRLPVYTYRQKFQGFSRGYRDVSIPGTIAERFTQGDPEPAMRAVRFFRALFEGNILEARRWGGKRALGEATLSAGGALVPEEFAQDVIAKLGDLTPLASREFLRVLPMTTDVMKVPRVVTLPEATYGTENVAWSTDEGKGTEPAVGEVELVAREAVLIVPASEQWIADANLDVISWLTELFADSLARLRNQMILLGNGTTQPEGIFSAGITPSNFDNTDQGTKQTSINGQFHDVKPRYREGAIWITSDIGLEILSNIRATTGEPIMNSILAEPFNRLKGKPLFVSEAVPKDAANKEQMVFGNFMFYLFGDRQAMQVATDSGGEAFKKRQVLVRVIERYDGKVGQAEAFSVMDGIEP